MADKASTERRVAPRATFDTPVTVIVDGRETTWVGRDISETGMGLAPTAHGMAARGQAVRVCFALPRRHQGVCGTRLVRWFEAEARVVRRGPRLGLRFLGVKDADRRAIRTYVFTGCAETRDCVPPPLQTKR